MKENKIKLPYRKIKFRVWNNKTQKWQHGGPHCHPDLDGVNLFGETILLGGFMEVPLMDLNDCVALQYTGLKDKNDREIFEGDIVKTGVLVGPVEFRNCSFLFDGHPLFNYYESISVIGNMFENPELLTP